MLSFYGNGAAAGDGDGLTHLMDGKANGSLRSNTAFPDGIIEQEGQSIDSTLGDYATALGAMTAATGMGAFAHGMMTMASGRCSHAEGAGASATGGGSHAEGEQTVASGVRSHAEGLMCTASGSESHASGALSEASGAGAFVHGQGLKASSPLQTVFGKYNVEDSNNEYTVILGNGTSNARSNALTVDWNGNTNVAGSLTLNMNSTNSATLTADMVNQMSGGGNGGIIFGYIVHGQMGVVEGIQGFTYQDIVPEDDNFNKKVPLKYPVLFETDANSIRCCPMLNISKNDSDSRLNGVMFSLGYSLDNDNRIVLHEDNTVTIIYNNN